MALPSNQRRRARRAGHGDFSPCALRPPSPLVERARSPVSAAVPIPGSGDVVAAPADDRLAAVGRLEATALGSRALQRLAQLAVRVLGASSAVISLIGDVELIVGGAGLAPGTLGRRVPLEESLCAAATASGPGPYVVADAVTDARVSAVPAVAAGKVGAYLGMPLTGASGEVVGALCVLAPRHRSWTDGDVALIRQLADSVATELELSALSREFEAHRLRFELAIDAAEIGSFDWDLASGRLVWDNRLVELFGYERDAFDETIEAFNARLHPDDLPRVAEALQTAIDAVAAYEAEYRVVLPTGETRWILAKGRALADDSGVAVRLLGAAYDTTLQRHADARVARVLEAMNAAFFALDRQWRFTYVNTEAERVLHRSREELLGGSIWDLFPAALDSDFEKHYRGAATTGEERVFEAYYPAPLDAWYEVRAWPSPDGLSVYFLDITERRAAEERARTSAARLAVIAEVGAVTGETLGSGAGEDAALQRLAEAVVPVLGDWVIVSLAGADGRMRDVGSWHADPVLRATVARYAEMRLAAIAPDAPILRALASGRTVAVPDVGAAVGRGLPPGEVSDVFWTLDPRTAVTLPLAARGRTLGALSLYRSAGRPAADEDDVATAQEVAARVALALDNARLYEQQRGLAEGLQRSLLSAPPAPDAAEIVVRYRPAVEVAQVGGDWYDAFVQPSGTTMLVIGDVVGHDTEAAAAMGQLRGLLRGIAYREGVGPAEVLRGLDVAVEGLELRAMATAAIVRIEQTPEERLAGLVRLRWSNAGHPPPLVLHPDGRVEQLLGERTDLMLGVDATFARSESMVTVER